MHAFIISPRYAAYSIRRNFCLYIDSQAGGAQPIATLDPEYIEFVNGELFGEIPHLVISLQSPQ